MKKQVFSSTLEGKRNQRSLISGAMEWKQELTEPRLHGAQQLPRYKRQKEESGPVTAPHRAPDSQSQYETYSKISPSEVDINTQFCIITTGEISQCNLSSNQSQVQK